MDDKLHLQLWTFDLFIVLTNFTLNVAMEIQIIFEIVYQCWNFAQKRSNFSPMILFIWILINKRYTQNYQLHTTKYADISKKKINWFTWLPCGHSKMKTGLWSSFWKPPESYIEAENSIKQCYDERSGDSSTLL